MKERTSDILTFKVDPHLRAHIEKNASEKNLKVGAYIKAVLKKHSKYKSPELVWKANLNTITNAEAMPA